VITVSIVKNQHYVPQSYLKHFSNNDQIWVFDKETKKSFKTNVKNIASEKEFYDLPDITVEHSNGLFDKQVIEKHFSQNIEGDFKKLLDRIRVRFVMSHKPENSIAIEDETKIQLSYHIALQYLRTRDFRDNFKLLEERLAQWLIDKELEDFEDYQKGDISISRNNDAVTVDHVKFMFDPEITLRLTHTLYNHIWLVGINKTNFNFYTSDNPVVKNGRIKDELISYEGLGSKGIEIAFPISSNLIIILVEREYFKDYEKVENQFIVLDNEEYIKWYNSIQVLSSFRQVYCEDNEFNFIQQMIKEQPDVLERKPKIGMILGGKEVL
jgi:hypothetical protein